VNAETAVQPTVRPSSTPCIVVIVRPHINVDSQILRISEALPSKSCCAAQPNRTEGRLRPVSLISNWTCVLRPPFDQCSRATTMPAYQNAHSAVEFNSVPSRTLRMDNLMPGFPFLASSLDAKVERNKARGGAAYCENPISQGIVMKARRSTQSKIARSNSDASLARSYFDLQRLRDEIRRAEAGCSLRRSKERPPRKHLAGWYHLT